MIELGSINVLDVIERPRTRETEKPEAAERNLCTAELAECTCPEFCERDHDTD